jgi:spermidine synthase
MLVGRMQSSVCLVFFLAGAAALLFETLWFHQLGLVLGNSVWTSTLVLAGFMGGLALGNAGIARWGHRVRRHVRLYAALEFAIGSGGLLLVHLLPALAPTLAPWLRPLEDLPWALAGLRMAVSFVLLLLPSTAMGATLPLLVGALYRRDPRFGAVLGRLYGWNTLGAVAGAIASHAFLIGWLGVRGTALFAATCNLLAAAGALATGRVFGLDVGDAPAQAPASRPSLPPRAAPLLVAAAIAGGILLALEVVWFRFLILFVLGGSLAFAILLGIVLTGIGVGGLLGARLLAWRPETTRALPYLALVAGGLAAGSYLAFEVPLAAYRSEAISRWPDVLALGAPLMLPVAILSGLLFTLLGETLHRSAPDETRSAGLLTLANTAGAMLGAVAGGFLLLPLLGIERSIQLLSASYLLVAVATVAAGVGPERAAGRAMLAVGGVGVLVLALVGASGPMASRYLTIPLDRFAAREGTRPVVIREGLTETILYLRSDVYGEPRYHRLVTNAHSMSSTHFLARRYMKLYVYWPMAVHPDAKHALLISYGVGVTAKALTDTAGLERIDVVDISRDILDLDHVVYPDPADRPLSDPRVRVHIEDGRHFLQTSNRRFDLITGEPPPPKAAGIVSLFTREYFALVRDRLNEGGITTYWLPVHSLLEPEAKAVIRAFCDVFDDCSLWAGADLDWMLVGTRNARGPVSAEAFSAQWRDPVVGPDLRDLGIEVPEQLGALFMAGADDLRALTRETAPLVDDFPKRIGSDPLLSNVQRRTYREWMRPDVARNRFAKQPLVERLWPPELRQKSLAYFAFQPLADGGARFPSNPRAVLERIHRLQTETPLRSIVAWQLERSADTRDAAEAARRRGRRGSALDYEAAVHALADRDYATAAHGFARAADGDPERREILYYRLYALAMAGSFDTARTLAAQQEMPNAAHSDDAPVWRFLTARFPRLAVGPTGPAATSEASRVGSR